MLRGLVALLLLANLAFLGWTQGWLTPVLGLSPDSDREPGRLAQQVEPASMQVLAPGGGRPQAAVAPPVPAPTVASAPAPAMPGSEPALAAVAPADTPAAPPPPPAAPVCLEAGPFTAAEWRTAEPALRAALGEEHWALTTREKPGSWIVYVGPYKSRTIMEKRADQLRAMEIAFEEGRDLPDEYLPGFLFGRHAVEADARALQARLTAQKVKYVRVIPLVRPTTTHAVRIARADEAIQARVAALRPRLSGHPFQPCGGGR